MSITVLKRKSATSRCPSLIRLERSHCTLVQLREKLTSYSMEPTTFSMHEEKEALLHIIDVLIKTHFNLIQELGNSKNSTEKQVTAINKQLTNVKYIEERMKEYISSKVSVE